MINYLTTFPNLRINVAEPVDAFVRYIKFIMENSSSPSSVSLVSLLGPLTADLTQFLGGS